MTTLDTTLDRFRDLIEEGDARQLIVPAPCAALEPLPARLEPGAGTVEASMAEVRS